MIGFVLFEGAAKSYCHLIKMHLFCTLSFVQISEKDVIIYDSFSFMQLWILEKSVLAPAVPYCDGYYTMFPPGSALLFGLYY